ncbi:MAG TPA: hypothetical protein PK858_07455, partial [Saprospiraceae bacterium]|nr:hypothetical protein [Saprospiraceae bacterium]
TFRNVYLLKPKAPNAPMRVLPFDFDFSGLVSAPYAMPTSQSGLRDVKERILMSDGLPQSAINAAAARFQHMEEQLLALSALPQLGKSTNRDLGRYVESFFSGPVPQVESAKTAAKNLR